MKEILEKVLKEVQVKKDNQLFKTEQRIANIILENFTLENREISELLIQKKITINIETRKKNYLFILDLFKKLLVNPTEKKILILKEIFSEKYKINGKEKYKYGPIELIMVAISLLKSVNIAISNNIIVNKELLILFLNKLDKKLEVATNEEVEELKKDLEIIREENEILKSQIEEQKENLKKEVILEFFREMNSSSNSNLLDNFYMSSFLFNTLDKNDDPLSPELDTISLTIKLFFKYLKKYKVYPKEKIGDLIEVNLNDISNYKYLGEEFTESNEIKKVEIESPGWRIENQIITKPTVKEVL